MLSQIRQHTVCPYKPDTFLFQKQMLAEFGARSAFRVESALGKVARRAAPFASSGITKQTENTDRDSPLERAQWAQGVRETRQRLEHGGVPSQYAVWVWPCDEYEAYPPDDALFANAKDSKKCSADLKVHDAIDSHSHNDSKRGSVALASSYAGGVNAYVTRTALHGFPNRKNEIEVVRKDATRAGTDGTVFVSRVTDEDVWANSVGDGSGDDSNQLDIQSGKQLAGRFLWEQRVDTAGERDDAHRKAGVLAVRELLKGDPVEAPSSDGSDGEPEPTPESEPPSSSESSDSEYESRYAFVPTVPTRTKAKKDAPKKSRGVIHAVLVFTGFRKKKIREKNEKLAEKEITQELSSKETEPDLTRALDETVLAKTRKTRGVSKSTLKPVSEKPEKPVKQTLGARRAEALSSVADALMRNQNTAQSDRWKGTKTLAETARVDAARKKELLLTKEMKPIATEAHSETDKAPPLAFGALGKYMRAAEREETCDWNAVPRRPHRRLLT